ncbi:XTP/dITP diphosphohydrolase [Malonomonas rubra DSM 5091]|uniref:dITP/XTP pyrophosphatase n=1 Tax=Malonomonas rubra DSM 5091 TaxID=1122189 RepID=A0A1M6DKP8_MALRU|nr:XTP/dITP diphosphatase [Malonomonas rubra]SHI73731.1 XTP/dITP diphosphohydrolase [Malonomonas rubra DSM 5091]
MKLLVATGNQGKLKEIRRLLDESGVEVIGLDQYPGAPEVIEDGDTFEANARKKALEMAEYSNCLTLADDSGLVVDALKGAPGVHSARFAGEQGNDAANNAKLLKELADVADDKRQAAFNCVMALATPKGDCVTYTGAVFGLILREQRGEGGFGYDPLFMVPEYGKTMAELPLDIKNRISHRGNALRQVIPVLQEMAVKDA